MACAAPGCSHALTAGSPRLIALLLLVTALMAFLHWAFEPLEALLGPVLSLSGVGWLALGGLIWLIAGRSADQ